MATSAEQLRSRTFRSTDSEWQAFREACAEDERDASKVLRKLMREHVRKARRKAK